MISDVYKPNKLCKAECVKNFSEVYTLTMSGIKISDDVTVLNLVCAPKFVMTYVKCGQ